MTPARYKSTRMKRIKTTATITAIIAVVASCGMNDDQSADLIPLSPPASPRQTTTVNSTTTTTIDPWSQINWADVANMVEHERQQARETHGICGEWHDLAISIGFDETEWDVLKQIIARETGDTCRADLLNDNTKTRDNSWGLTQINTLGDLWPGRKELCGLNEPADLLDPTINLSCARKIYEHSGWAPWRYPWNATTTTTTEGPTA